GGGATSLCMILESPLQCWNDVTPTDMPREYSQAQQEYSHCRAHYSKDVPITCVKGRAHGRWYHNGQDAGDTNVVASGVPDALPDSTERIDEARDAGIGHPQERNPMLHGPKH